jgi:hypothetical protein
MLGTKMDNRTVRTGGADGPRARRELIHGISPRDWFVMGPAPSSINIEEYGRLIINNRINNQFISRFYLRH